MTLYKLVRVPAKHIASAEVHFLLNDTQNHQNTHQSAFKHL